ncbi:MAG: hypothetical protein HY272_02915 [Gammaproteobacteria bacterium]|nr:hypothetical protein [Gammaproteobacteria bacterium]
MGHTGGESKYEAEQAIAARFVIRSIPILMMFKNGREVDRQADAMGIAWVMMPR